MSGVYIRGMEMPKCCADCLNVGWQHVFECNLNDVEHGERRADCPLIHVPDYGRLIDADKATEKVWELMRFPSNLANAQWFENTLREMPTVIPEEECET